VAGGQKASRWRASTAARRRPEVRYSRFHPQLQYRRRRAKKIASFRLLLLLLLGAATAVRRERVLRHSRATCRRVFGAVGGIEVGVGWRRRRSGRSPLRASRRTWIGPWWWRHCSGTVTGGQKASRWRASTVVSHMPDADVACAPGRNGAAHWQPEAGEHSQAQNDTLFLNLRGLIRLLLAAVARDGIFHQRQ